MICLYHLVEIKTIKTIFSLLMLLNCILENDGFPQFKNNHKMLQQEGKLFYDVDKTGIKKVSGGGIYLDENGSPVERTLRTLLALRHHSSPVIDSSQVDGSKNYKTFLENLPGGIAMKHIAKLVPDHLPDEFKSASSGKIQLHFKDDQKLSESKKIHRVIKKDNGEIGFDDPDYLADSEVEDSISDSRGRAPTDTIEEETKKVSLAPGLNIDTTDWTKESNNWLFKGGEWSKIILPDLNNHPSLPHTEVPGPALVVIAEDPLKKLFLRREVPDLHNISLHFRYFLTNSLTINKPELNVFVITRDNVSHSIGMDKSYGVWSHMTIPIEFAGPIQLAFEARRLDINNEIALDDITVSGYHEESISKIAIKQAEEEEVAEEEEEEEEEATSEGMMVTSTSSISSTSIFSSVSISNSSTNETDVRPVNVTADNNYTTQNQSGNGSLSLSTSSGNFNNSDESQSTANADLNTTVDSNSLSPDSEDTTTISNSSSFLISGELTTNSSINNNAIISSSTVNSTQVDDNLGITNISSINPQVEGTVTNEEIQSISNIISTLTESQTKFPEEFVSNISSTWAYNVISSTNGDIDGNEAFNNATTWGVVKVFIVLTVVGACVLALLYWRKRRQYLDDEVPVFSRHAYSDFNNPTYSEDQSEVDSSSLRPGDSTSNYRSFE